VDGWLWKIDIGGAPNTATFGREGKPHSFEFVANNCDSDIIYVRQPATDRYLNLNESKQ
jgi:hypothetical protein